MTATNPTLAAAYDNLDAAFRQQRADIALAIDSVESAVTHGGKDAVLDRLNIVRRKVDGLGASMDAMRQVAGHIGSLPVKVDAVAEPVVGTIAAPALAADNQPAQASGLASEAARTRGTRTSASGAEG